MKEVNASIITIGDELLIGQTIDTNSAYIAQELNALGIWVKKRIAIGDIRSDILDALTEQSKEAKVVVITGGLGPTADDITKPTLCDYFGARLVVNEEALQNVHEIFRRLNRPLIDRNLKQAEVPDNCIVLPNGRGTAPGMWFEKDGVIYVSLPGVPHEMKGLMQSGVLPRLKKELELPGVVHRTLLTSGVGESVLAETIADFEQALPPHIKLAYLPAYGLVRLRLTGRGASVTDVEEEVDSLFHRLQPLVKEWMVADEDIPLEEAVSRLLREKKKVMATAESCTGGQIAEMITARAGASSIYNGSVVAYSNAAKEALLGVQKETLERYGAVSEQTVREMVAGVRTRLGADYAIATSGIMGPEGGSAEKPVGTVWMAVANAHRTVAFRHRFRFDRSRNIELTAHNALTMLYRFVREEEGE